MIRSRSRSRGGAGGGGDTNSPTSSMRLVTDNHFVDSVTASASYNRRCRKRFYVAASATGDIFMAFPRWYMSNVASVANAPDAATLSATAEYNGTIYPVTFSGASSVNHTVGTTVWGKIVGLTAITAGQFLYVNSRQICATTSSVNRLRGVECNARFDEGALSSSDTTDEISSYGIGSTCSPGALSSGALVQANFTFNNSQSNALYTNGDTLIAFQTQADGTILQRIVGTYTTTAGNPTAAVITDVNTDWVAPTIKVCSRIGSFGSLTGDIYAPVAIVAVPTVSTSKQVLIVGDSNGHSSADAAQSVNGFKGLYERGINGQHATANISYSGRKASDVDDINTGGLSTIVDLYRPYISHVLIALGGNDAATDSAATIEGNLNTQATYWRSVSKYVGYSTIPPRTTGTFTTDGGQTEATGFGAAGVVDTVNNDIKVGSTGITSDFNVFDFRESVESVTAVTKWRSDGGVAFTDGTHLTQLGCVVVGSHMANWPILLQAVAMRAEIASSRLQGSASARSDVTGDVRIKIYMPGVAVSGLRMSYPGFTHIASSGGGEAALGNGYTLNTAFENNAGSTYYKAQWRGADLGTIPNNKFYISDVTPTIATTANEQIYARSSIFLSSSTEYFPRQNNAFTSGGGDFVSYAPSPAPGQAFASGTMAIPTGGSNALRGCVPFLMLGVPASPIISVAGIGDSILVGEGDQTIDTKGSNGWFRQAMESVGGNNVPYTMLGVSGSRFEYDTLALSPLKRQVLRYHTHVYIEYGTNDINAGTSLATIQGYLTNLCNEIKAIKGPYGSAIKICVQKIAPRCSGTSDTWQTTGGQTVNANFTTGSVRDLYNQWLDTQVGTLFDYLFDPNPYIEADPVSGNANYGKWVVNGASNYATSDGTHPRSAMADLVAPQLSTLVATWTP